MNMSLKKIEPIMKSHKNPSKLSSDFGELQTPNHCQKSKISQQNHPPKLHQFRPQHPTDDSTGPRCWFPMAKDPWWFSSLTIVVGLEPFYKKRWKKCHAVSVSPICRVFFAKIVVEHTQHSRKPTHWKWVTRKQRYVNDTGIYCGMLYYLVA